VTGIGEFDRPNLYKGSTRTYPSCNSSDRLQVFEETIVRGELTPLRCRREVLTSGGRKKERQTCSAFFKRDQEEVGKTARGKNWVLELIKCWGMWGKSLFGMNH